MRIFAEVFLEPVPRFEVEMVRRLVEEEQRGPAEQEFGERDAHLPAARERLRRPAELFLSEAEPAKDGRDLEIEAVAVGGAEAILQLAVTNQVRLVLGFGNGPVGQPLLEIVQVGLHRQDRLEGQHRLVEEGAPAVIQPVLRQVADGQVRRPEDLSFVRLLEACQHPQQRRLAGAVRAAEPDTLAPPDLPRHVVEQHAFAERLAQRRKLNHLKRTILARASPAALTCPP